MEERNYWVCRIDTTKRKKLQQELLEGRLRQGWGWNPDQKLPKCKMNEGARRNLPIYNRVKKGDYLLIPHFPDNALVAIVEATEDFNIGYHFEILKETGDHGHIFPVRFHKSFSRHAECVSANIRSTLKTPMRFWNIRGAGEQIENILNQKDSTALMSSIDLRNRLDNTIGDIEGLLNIDELAQKIMEKCVNQFHAADWEHVLVYCFQTLYPAYKIEHVGGKNEQFHGADILIKIPTFNARQYVVAIQVKDYSNQVGKDPIGQICKSDAYFANMEDGEILIEKCVALIHANKEQNEQFDKEAGENDVTILYENDVKALLLKTALMKNIVLS